MRSLIIAAVAGFLSLDRAMAQLPGGSATYAPVEKIVAGNQPIAAAPDPDPVSPVNPYYLSITSPVYGVTFPCTVTLSFSVLTKPDGVSDEDALGFVSASPATLQFTGPNQTLQSKIAVNVPLGDYDGEYKWKVIGDWPANVTNNGAFINASVYPPLVNPDIKPEVSITAPADGQIFIYDGVNPVSFQIDYSAIVAENGYPLTALQLFFDGTPVTPFLAPELGESSANASAISPNITDGGVHTITATAQNNSGGGEHTIHINVYAPPRITGHPASRTVFLGDSTTFSVTATATPAPTYQWQKDGVDIAGANGSTYTISSATAGDAGQYRVVVTNNWLEPVPTTNTVTSNPATLAVTLGKRPQAITFPAIEPRVYGDAPFDPGAIASSGLPVSYVSSNPAVASVDGSLVTMHAVGLATITASQEGNEGYEPAASVGRELVVNKAGQTITLNPVPPTTVELGIPPFSMNAVSATAAINPLVYEAQPVEVVEVSPEGIVTARSAGSATITVSQPGNENYEPAVPVLHALVVTAPKITPVIEWPAPADIVVGTPLGSAQLNALALHEGTVVGGTYAYSPDAGTELPVGTHQLSVTFLPDDSSVYETASATTFINVVASPDECGTALVRHAIALNGKAAIDGSVQILLPETVSMNGNAWISGDLLMPGSPGVVLNGTPVLGAVVDGDGTAAPEGHALILNGNALVGRLVKRTDAVVMPDVGMPPTTWGTRDIKLNKPGAGAGDFATVRDISIGGNAGQVAIPPGTYRNVSVAGNNGLVLGVAGATEEAAYDLQQLKLSGRNAIQVLGPVVITVASDVRVTGNSGNEDHPDWLSMRIADGNLTLAGNVTLHGSILAPTGTVTLNNGDVLRGGVISDRLVINGNGLVDPCSGR